MKSAGKARNNGLYRHIRTSKEIIRNLLNDSTKYCVEGTLNPISHALIAERDRPSFFANVVCIYPFCSRSSLIRSEIIYHHLSFILSILK